MGRRERDMDDSKGTTPEKSMKSSLDYGVRPWRRGPYLKVAVGVGAAIVVLAVYLHLSRQRPVPGLLPETGLIVSGQDAGAYYGKAISPLLDDFDNRNLAAADRAIVTLHDRIVMHRAGIKPFTEDITSWGSRFGIVGRYSSDLWEKWWDNKKNADAVTQYVEGKFEADILSDGKLRDDISVVLAQFNHDVSASRYRLYAALPAVLMAPSSPLRINQANFEDFQKAVGLDARDISRSLAPDTMDAGIASLVVFQVINDSAPDITSQIIDQVLIQLGIATAAESIEAGGSTVGGAAIGGGAGSLGGPIGTVIGIGVGLVTGAIVDWWLSKEFDAQVTKQCNDFLDLVDQRLSEGTAKSPGLKLSLCDAVRIAGEAQRQAILKELKSQGRLP